ncbi:exodeoxyribonuclease V subunit gamma [Gordonia sp. (in: high G+C Gram-positive bacteria)]|uniref:exodeoxyribonuclease V subunit gamma n=1 Tax=Gordonia sp. (in: high G+C Gram-positive bacteria) TaxID=84139 RepID=UPI00169931A0|nr:exodeoxyribonuclease V subunit gamma [Gordonia sp. (in: high G+C Gram-positive bacteria)]NLG46341.1 exodeoxyribonuclease V subunit gamma [Gordonia sp. (in: high G+C Gram-positive bacteria)]
MLTVHRAEQAEQLVGVLDDTLSVPLADPMQTEIVAVPERGVERWLRQQLSLRLGTGGFGPGGLGPGGLGTGGLSTGGFGTGDDSATDGIAANIAFDSPRFLLRQVMDGVSTDPDASESWFADNLRWPVLRVLDEHLDDPELTVLAAHLGQSDGTGDRRGRRLSTASTIAGLFGSYGWQRPSMIAAWAAGDDTDGAGGALADHLRWQPWFWRQVRREIGHPHLAEELPSLVTRLRDDPAAVDLPDRLGLFGATRIPQTLLTVLSALATEREIALYLPHPSPRLWDQVADSLGTPTMRLRSSRPALRLGHPLLASLSRDVQDLQEVLTPLAGETVHHRSPAPARTTLLGHLQEGLRRDQLTTVDSATADGSVEVHACHGPSRQVEVLRDRLLHLFDADPTLEPRDVLIMCPDVETFAPLIGGAFGQTGLRGEHPAFSLRVRMADRGIRMQNAVLDVLARVLDLAAGRVRAGDLLDLVGAEPVRRRFGFSDDDVDALSSWVQRSGVRWGVDDAQRRRFGLGGFPQGTVQTGLDRILLGVVAEEAENQWLATALPLSGIDSTDTDLAGRFAEFAQRLTDLLAAVSVRQTSGDWSALLVRIIDLLTDTDSDSQWQRGQAVGMVAAALATPEGTSEPELELADLRDLMTQLLLARPTRSNFCTGELTVCSMVPMRSVPHRVIAILGMDSGSYPRAGAIDGDDILQVAPMVGERNVRDEDRQVFLDAINAATDSLLVFYTGADALTGAQTPPAVVVSELLDTARAVLGVGTGLPVPVLTRHTLHAFDEANFVADQTPPFSYDAGLLGAARALSALTRAGERGPQLPVIADEVLPDADRSGDVDLDELIAFLSAPVEGYARQRLGVGLPDQADEHSDELAVQLDGLERWGVGNRFLAALLAGDDPTAAQGAELRRGSLPPFAFGAREFAPIRERAQAVATAAYGYRSDSADAVDVRVALPDGRRIYGTVGDIFSGRLVPVSFSKLGPKHRLAAWVRLLAMAAGSDRQVHEAIVIGSASGRYPAAKVSRLTAPEHAAELLTVLVTMRDAGLSAPIGLTLDAAGAAAAEYNRVGKADSALRRAKYAFASSYADPNRYAGLVFLGDPEARVEFPTLHAAMPTAAAMAPAAPWLPGDDSTDMYVRLSSALFGPLLQNEDDR